MNAKREFHQNKQSNDKTKQLQRIQRLLDTRQSKKTGRKLNPTTKTSSRKATKIKWLGDSDSKTTCTTKDGTDEKQLLHMNAWVLRIWQKHQKLHRIHKQPETMRQSNWKSRTRKNLHYDNSQAKKRRNFKSKYEQWSSPKKASFYRKIYIDGLTQTTRDSRNDQKEVNRLYARPQKPETQEVTMSFEKSATQTKEGTIQGIETQTKIR